MININEMFSIVKDMKIETLKDNATFQELDSFVSELKNSSNPQHRFMALRLENRLKENQNYQEYRKSIELKTEEKREIDREKKINKEFDEKQAIGGRVMDAKKKAEAEKIKKEEKELADFSLKNLSFNQQMIKIQMMLDNIDKYNPTETTKMLGNINEEIRNTQDFNKKNDLIGSGVELTKRIMNKGQKISSDQMGDLTEKTDELNQMAQKNADKNPNNTKAQKDAVEIQNLDFKTKFMKNHGLGWDPETKSYLDKNNRKTTTIIINGKEVEIDKVYDEERSQMLTETVKNSKTDESYKKIIMPTVSGIALSNSLGKTQDHKKAEGELINGVLKTATDNNAKKIVGEDAPSEILDEEKIKIAYIATKEMLEKIKNNHSDELNVVNLTIAKIRNYMSGISQDMALDENIQKMYKEHPAEFDGYIEGLGFTSSDVKYIRKQLDSHNKYYEEHPTEYEKLINEANNRSEEQTKYLLYISQNIDIVSKFFSSEQFQDGKHTAIEFRTLLTKNIYEQVSKGGEPDVAKALNDTIIKIAKEYNLDPKELKSNIDGFIKENAASLGLSATNLNEVYENTNKHLIKVNNLVTEQIKNTNVEEAKQNAENAYNMSNIVATVALNKINNENLSHKTNKQYITKVRNWDMEFVKDEDFNATIIANKVGDIMQKTINGENQKMIEESQQPDNKPSYAENANKMLRQMQEQEKEEMGKQNNVNFTSNSSSKA